MTIRQRTERLLLKLGANPAHRGFEFVCDAMELFEIKSIREGRIMDLYDLIADHYKEKGARIEVGIRTCFSSILSGGNLDIVQEYFSFTETTNKSMLHALWKALEREVKEELTIVKIDAGIIDIDDEAKKVATAIKIQVMQSAIKILEKEIKENGNQN